MSDLNQLVAVIVTFNRLDKLKVTLSHTLANRFAHIVVVNNASTDGTDQWLDNLADQRLHIIHSKKNLGGAGGFHIGFKYVSEQLNDADWLVCFDDDAYPEANVVDVFESLDVPDDAGSLAAAVYLPDGERISEMNRPSRNPFWHLRHFLGTAGGGRKGFHVRDSDYLASGHIEIDTSSFVGCFVRVRNIRQGLIGLPRSELFIYADDVIYILESRKAGFQHLFVPALRFRHDCETLINQQDVYHPLWKVYYTYRNRLELYRIASTWLYPLVLLVKIPSFLLAVRHYDPAERGTFLRLARASIADGLRRDYSKPHTEVLELAKVEHG